MIILDTNYESIEEQLTYDANNLYADAGGLMGLLLGASFLSLYDVFMEIMDWIVNLGRTKKDVMRERMKKRRKEEEGDE